MTNTEPLDTPDSTIPRSPIITNHHIDLLDIFGEEPPPKPIAPHGASNCFSNRGGGMNRGGGRGKGFGHEGFGAGQHSREEAGPTLGSLHGREQAKRLKIHRWWRMKETHMIHRWTKWENKKVVISCGISVDGP